MRTRGSILSLLRHLPSLRIPLLLALVLLSVSEASAARVTGRVKYYVAEKQFGMITRDDGGKDILFRWTEPCSNECAADADCAKCPAAENRVEFDVVRTNRGPEAINVVLQ